MRHLSTITFHAAGKGDIRHSAHHHAEFAISIQANWPEAEFHSRLSEKAQDSGKVASSHLKKSTHGCLLYPSKQLLEF